MVAMLVVWALWSSVNPNPNISPSFQTTAADKGARDFSEVGQKCAGDMRHDSPEPTFYDEPEMSYSIEKSVENWDEKRRVWLKNHPSFGVGVRDRVLLVTGSQPSPCKNPIGDHLLLRFFKNKVDYCRIHGCDVFYNNVLLHPKMFSFWAKLPIVRAAMFAHPDVEWIWWVDSDAMFSDMEFKLPLEKYKDHNLILHGWSHLVHQEKSWTGLNAGVFLIRNCQWSMDFMDVWANMGPQSPEYDHWGQIQRSLFKDKLFPASDDQSALVYLISMEKEKWADRIYLENEYYFQGYWIEIIGTFGNITDKYVEIEKKERRLARRHAEKVSEFYGTLREQYMEEAGIGYGKGTLSLPFITHFTGCQPCSGDHNKMYSGESCWDGMQKALTFADNQVLRNYGFVHPDLLDSSTVNPLPSDSPDA